MIHTPDAVSVARRDRAARVDVRVRPVDDHKIVVAVAGDLDLATAPTLKTALLESVALGHREVVLDLSGVGDMDSTGLAVLIGLRERLKDGGRLWLAGAPAGVLRVLELTGLTGRFELVASAEDLVGSVGEAVTSRRQPALTADAQIALGLLATALPFAESRRAEAERWLRVLSSHGDAARMLREVAGAESAHPAPAAGSVAAPGRREPDRRDPIQSVIDHAQELARHRGLNLIGTTELLAAVVGVYSSEFDAILAARGTSRSTVLRRLSEHTSTG